MKTKSRTIKYIVVHCTAGNPKATPKDVLAEFRNKGWKHPGYHYIVTQDGKIHNLTPDNDVANGVRGYNTCSLHVAWTGGMDGKDTRTEAQKAGLRTILHILRAKYPDAKIQGHRDFPGVRKTCPNFDAITEYAKI